MSTAGIVCYAFFIILSTFVFPCLTASSSIFFLSNRMKILNVIFIFLGVTMGTLWTGFVIPLAVNATFGYAMGMNFMLGLVMTLILTYLAFSEHPDRMRISRF